jgi:hypothetical protein
MGKLCYLISLIYYYLEWTTYPGEIMFSRISSYVTVKLLLFVRLQEFSS